MANQADIHSVCENRMARHQEEAWEVLRHQSAIIEGSSCPLSDHEAQRPFMLPWWHDPFQIWEYILDYVTDPKEIMKLWNVCDLFREILNRKQKYIQSRLPHVVQLILDKRPNFLPITIDRFPRPFEWRNPFSTLDTRNPKVSRARQVLLKVRHVSYLCKVSVERLLLTADSKKLYLNLDSPRKIQWIISHMDVTYFRKDWFFPQRIKIKDDTVQYSPDRLQEFSAAVKRLFELAGERVISLRYHSSGRPDGIYETLREWMVHLPNLQNLNITVESWRWRNQIVVSPNLEDLMPFPNCAQLQSFKTGSTYQDWETLPRPYVQRILDAINPEIKTLSYLDESCQNFIDPLEISRRFEHLECLRTTISPALLRHLALQMPLKEIVFHAEYDFCTSSEVFPFLNQFGNTLERLKLRADITITEGTFLDLPNLKFFEWWYEHEVDDSFQDLGFLLHAGRLEIIRTVIWEWDNYGRYDFVDDFYKQITEGFEGLNMWKVFPELKEFITYFGYDRYSIKVCRYNTGQRMNNRVTHDGFPVLGYYGINDP